MTQSRTSHQESLHTDLAAMHQDLLSGMNLTRIGKDPLTDTHINVPNDQAFSVDSLLSKLENDLYRLQSQDFDYIHHHAADSRFLVKDLRGVANDALNAIHPLEAQIQAIRYVRGMVLFAKCSANHSQMWLFEQIFHYARAYNESLDDMVAPHVATTFLANRLTELIESTLEVTNEQARWQLVMARDLGTLLEQHTPICTITETENKISIETSQLIKLSQDTYAQELSDLENKTWFKEACRLTGLLLNADTNWLQHFFTLHRDELAQHGSPATPSSRWLPIPANVIHEQINTFNKADQSLVSHTQFYRTGVAVPYEIRITEERQRLAKVILKMLVMQLLEEKLIAYKKEYEGLLDPNNFKFYVNYQTLLSPLPIVDMKSHKENNSEFIKIIKNTMTELQRDKDIKQIAKRHGAYLSFTHTNSAINKHAHLAKKFEKDYVVYELLKKPNLWQLDDDFKAKREIIPECLAKDIETRLQAFQYFRRATNHQFPFDGMSHFQRNTMLAALELLMMQGPALNFVGCKSSRDRTSVLMASVKTMQENPKAMHDWPTLEKGIMHCMEEGHFFRAMSHHSAVVKLKAVRKEYYDQLSPALQSGITLMKPFSKKLDKEEVTKKLKNRVTDLYPPPKALHQAIITN